MARLSLFNSPLMLGFEQFEQALDRISKTSADGYPPYNVEQVGENRLRITLAVAGFAADNLQVQIQDNQLVVRVKQEDEKGQGLSAPRHRRAAVPAQLRLGRRDRDDGLIAG